MIRLVPLAILALTNCQLIINHNTYEAPADGGDDDDAPPDTQGVPANAIESTAPEGVIVASAYLSPGGTVVSDGNWLTGATPAANGDFFRYALTFAAFDAPPNCACTTIGPNNHGCGFSNVQTASATLSVFNLPGELQNRAVHLICVGKRADALPGRATSPATGTMQLSTLRYDRTNVGGPILTEDGAWVGAATAGGPPFPLAIDPVYTAAPNCACQMTTDGNPSGSNCKLESETTLTQVRLSETANSGPGSPVAHDLMCLGPAATDRGPHLVSSLPGGAIIASASFQGDPNSVLRQDGAWIRSQPDGISGGQENAVKYETTVFSGPPRCLCSTLDQDGAACHVMSAPNTTDFSVHVMATKPVNGPNSVTLESNFSLICIGPR